MGYRILIVEDSATQARRLNHNLSTKGYQCFIAGTGREGLELAQLHHPHLIISDIVMPDLNGYQFCKLIKSHDELNQIPVILLTSLSDATDILRGLECGADIFITKPYDEEYLINKIDHILNQSGMRAEEQTGQGVTIEYAGERHQITSNRDQILNLLISTYDQAVQVNKRLRLREQELEASNSRLAALNAISETVSRSLELNYILNNTVDKLIDILNLDSVGIFILEQEQLVLKAMRNLPAELAAVFTAERITHNRFKQLFPPRSITNFIVNEELTDNLGQQLSTVCKSNNFNTLVCAPLQTGGEIIGLMTVYSCQQQAFQQADVDLINNIGNQIAAAVKNSLLYHEGQAARNELHSLLVELKESEARFRRLANSNIIGVCFWEFDGRILHANNAFLHMLGYSDDELSEGQLSWQKITPPESQKAEFTDQEEFLGAGGLVERAYLHKDGHRVPVLVGVALLEGMQKRGAAYMLDLTDQKRAEEERSRLLTLEQNARKMAEVANRAKDEFIATVSHELRTPLTAIMGWLKLIRSGKLDRDNYLRALETIERNARAQTQLIEDLLDISRIISGKLTLNYQVVELEPLIIAMIDSVRPSAEAKSIRIFLSTTSSEIGDFKVSGDATRLQQVIGNLLSNAIKFTPNGGRVTVELGQSNNFAEIKIIDTGKGIEAEFIPHVFEPFRQADNSSTRHHGGLGLGLAIVQNLVQMHGGSISVQSAGSGQGSTFTIMFPLWKATPATSFIVNPVKELSINKQSLQWLHILIVDDDLATVEMLTAVFTLYGAKVETATSAQAARRVFEQHPLDVIISDIAMPGEDGYQLIRSIRTSESTASNKMVPAIALTAFAKAEDRQKALLAGFQMHISKPVDPQELVQAVIKITSDSSARDANNS